MWMHTEPSTHKAAKKPHRNRFLVLSLPNYTAWNAFVLCSTIADFYLATLCFTLLPEHIFTFVPIFIASDLLYIFNTGLLLLHKYWNKLSIRLPRTVQTPSPYLVLDLVTMLPQVTLLLVYFRPDYREVVLGCRLVICLRLYKLKLFGEVQGELSSIQRRWTLFLLKSFVYVLVAVHAANAAWFLVTEKYPGGSAQVVIRNGGIAWRETPGNWYFLTTYLSLQTLFGVGFGDYTASNDLEAFWFLSVTLTGYYLCITFLAVACWLVINAKFHEEMHSQMMLYLDNYTKQVTALTRNCLRSYYNHLWRDYQGIYHAKLLDSLPVTLQMDVAFDINCALLHKSLLLKQLPPVYYKNVTKHQAVCLERGTLEACYDDDDHHPVVSFGAGTILGEVSLFLNLSSKTAVRAIIDAEVRVLDKVDFIRIMLDYHEELKAIRKAVAKRIDVVEEPEPVVAPTNLKRLRAPSYEHFPTYNLKTATKQPSSRSRIFKVATNNAAVVKAWRWLQSLIQTALCLAYPYWVIFEGGVPYDLYVFGTIADALYFIDLLLQCTTSVKYKDKTLTDVLDIVDVRLESWRFYCDVFSLFPIETWAYVVNNAGDRIRIYDLLKLNRLLRTWRVQDLFASKDTLTVRLSKSVVYSSVFTYYVACFLYLSACSSYFCLEDSWYNQKIIKDLQVKDDVVYSDNTLPTSCYFALTPVFYLGLGDILAKSNKDMVSILIILVVSLFLKTYWSSQVVAASSLKNICSRTYQTASIFKATLNGFQLPKRLKRRLNSVTHLPQKHVRSFLKATTPGLLQQQLHLFEIHDALASLPFFNSADVYFLTMVENEAKTLTVPSSEVVYHRGDPTRRLYVLQSGYCNLYGDNQTLEKIVGPGAQLGLVEMLGDVRKRHTVVANTDCLFVVMDYRTFSKILKLFPNEYNAVKSLLKSHWFLGVVQRYGRAEEWRGASYKQRQSSFIKSSWSGHWNLCKAKLGVFAFFGWFLVPCVVHPHSLFMKTWCGLRCTMIVFIAAALPLLVLVPTFTGSLYWLVRVCQCSLYLDMYVLLHAAYYNKRGGLETRPLFTAWNYITHSFVLDLVAALPVAEFFPSYQSGKLLSLVQFARVVAFIDYLKTSHWKWKKVISVLKSVLVLTLLLNILTSFLLAVACNQYSGTMHCSVFSKLPDASSLYLTALYATTSFLTLTGLGDVTAQSLPTTLAVIVTALIGFTSFSWVSSIIVTWMLGKATTGISFRKKTLLLEQFLYKNRVSSDLQKQVLDHLDFIWERNKGLNHANLLCDLNLNQALAEDVLLTQYKNCLKRCRLFHNLDDHSLRLIVKSVKLRYFKKGELILDYKDVVSDIFVVISGEVQVLDEAQRCLDTLGVGTAFGNLHQSAYSCVKVYVKARRNVELCVITTEDLLDIAKYHSGIFRCMKDVLDEDSDYAPPRQTDSGKVVSDFWNEIESETEPPAKKSSVELISPLRALKPHHHLFKVTDLLTFLASCANVVFVPYVFVTQDRRSVCYLYLLLEPVFYIRIYVKLRQGYVNFYGNFIRSNRKIARRYLSAPVRVVWDALANVPLALVCFASAREEWFFFYTCLRLLHVLRAHYVLDYFKTHESKLKFKPWLLLAKLCTIYFMILHLLSCFWLMLSCPFGSCRPGTWIFKKHNNASTVPPGPASKMLLSYYYVTSTVTSIGIGDITPQTTPEIYFTTVVMLLEKVMTGILVGAVLKTLYCSNFDLVRFEYKVAVLKKHLGNQNLSAYQMKRVWNHLRNLWSTARGRNFPQLLHQLPYALTCRIMTSVYGHHLSQNLIFKNVSQPLLRQISSKLQRVIFFKDEYVVCSGDVNSCMYFIHSGSVAVLTEHPDFTETQHVVLHASDMFGVAQGFGQGVAHHFTYRAATAAVEVLVLPYHSWSFLLPHFPQDDAVIWSRVKRECAKI